MFHIFYSICIMSHGGKWRLGGRVRSGNLITLVKKEKSTKIGLFGNCLPEMKQFGAFSNV